MSEPVAPTQSHKPTLGLFGFGAFGQLVAAALRGHFRIAVHDRSETARQRAKGQGHTTTDLAEAAASDVVLLAVPVPAFEPLLRTIGPHLRPGALVVDVASIKEVPARLMDELLPRDVQVVATHPMFGPQSARDGLSGLKVVVCPVRDRAWLPVVAFARRMGLKVIVATPEEHDRQAAQTQGLTHLLARALSHLDPSTPIRTRSFELLMAAIAMVRDDAPEVYDAVTRSNRHVAGLRDGLLHSLAEDSTVRPPR